MTEQFRPELFDDSDVAIIIILTEKVVAIVSTWQTIVMLRLKLNDRLVDIASEGLLRSKLYDEKETFDFTAVKNCWK
jgi:hypothetical protein